MAKRDSRHEQPGDAKPRAGKERGSRRGSLDPAIGVATVLLGCLLTFYLVGFLLIPLGAWLWRRALPS